MKQFLPPGTIESQPLEYEWRPFLQAEIFVASDDLDSMRSWWTERFGGDYTISEDHRDSSHVVNLDGDAYIELRVVETDDAQQKAGFQEFLASENLQQMEQTHQPKSLGVALLSAEPSVGSQASQTYAVEYVETSRRLRYVNADSAEQARKLVQAEVTSGKTLQHEVISSRTKEWKCKACK